MTDPVEALAAALHQVEDPHLTGVSLRQRDIADAQLAALRSSGFDVVPTEPKEPPDWHDIHFPVVPTGEAGLDVERLARAVLDEATCDRWGDLHSIRWASETFAALVAERYNGTMPAKYARLSDTGDRR